MAAPDRSIAGRNVCTLNSSQLTPTAGARSSRNTAPLMSNGGAPRCSARARSRRSRPSRAVDRADEAGRGRHARGLSHGQGAHQARPGGDDPLEVDAAGVGDVGVDVGLDEARHHRAQLGPSGGRGELGGGPHVGVAPRADATVRPRLRGDPRHELADVGDGLRCPRVAPDAERRSRPAFVRDHHRVAVRREEHLPRSRVRALVRAPVGRDGEDRRDAVGGGERVGQDHVQGQAHAVRASDTYRDMRRWPAWVGPRYAA